MGVGTGAPSHSIPEESSKLAGRPDNVQDTSSSYILQIKMEQVKDALWNINDAISLAVSEGGGRSLTIEIDKGDFVFNNNDLTIRQDNFTMIGKVGESGEPVTTLVGSVRIFGAQNVTLENLIITSAEHSRDDRVRPLFFHYL